MTPWKRLISFLKRRKYPASFLAAYECGWCDVLFTSVMPIEFTHDKKLFHFCQEACRKKFVEAIGTLTWHESLPIHGCQPGNKKCGVPFCRTCYGARRARP